MGYKSGGLSYFEDGGSADQEEQTTTSVQAKPIAAKGKFGMPALAGNVPVNESVLEQMGRLYMQRQEQRGGMRGFLNAIKDASAWGVGPEAVAARDKLRQEQEAEDMQFGSQIAQYRSALASQKAFEDRRAKELGLGGGGAEGQTPAGQVAGTLDVPPELKRALLNARTEAEYNEIVKSWALEKAKETQLQKNIRFAGSPTQQGGLGVPSSELGGVAVANIAGSGSFTPQDVRTASGTVQTTPLQEAKKIAAPPGVGTPAPPSAAAPKPLPQAQAQPPQGAPAPGGQPPAAGAPAAPTPRPAAPRPAAPAPAPAAAAPAPVAPPAPPAAPGGVGTFGFAPGSKEALELQQKGGEAVIAGREAEFRKTGEDLALQRAGVVEAGSSAPEQIARINYLEQLVTDPKLKDAFGVLQKPGVVAAVQSLLSQGVSLATLGPVGLQGIDEAVAKLGGTQAQIDARQKAAREFALMQLQNAKTLLKGQGAVSNAERDLVADMSGNIGKSPSAIKDLLAWSRIRTNYDQKNGQAYAEFLRRNPNSSFQEYKNSPLYQQIKDEYVGNLNQFVKRSATPAVAPAAKAPHPAEKLLEKYAPRKQ